jgi:hypothetical protein
MSETFQEYIERRTKYAIEAANRSKLIDMDYAFLALLQAQWAREYWFNKALEMEDCDD